ERTLHLVNDSSRDVGFTLEVDAGGDGTWQPSKVIEVPADGYVFALLGADVAGDWLRLIINRDARVTAFLHLQTPATPTADRASVFASLAPRSERARASGGLVRPAGF